MEIKKTEIRHPFELWKALCFPEKASSFFLVFNFYKGVMKYLFLVFLSAKGLK